MRFLSLGAGVQSIVLWDRAAAPVQDGSLFAEVAA